MNDARQVTEAEIDAAFDYMRQHVATGYSTTFIRMVAAETIRAAARARDHVAADGEVEEIARLFETVIHHPDRGGAVVSVEHARKAAALIRRLVAERDEWKSHAVTGDDWRRQADVDREVLEAERDAQLAAAKESYTAVVAERDGLQRAFTLVNDLKTRAQAERDEARAALKPFADLASDYERADASRATRYRDEGRTCVPHSDSHRVSIGLDDCRAAQSALHQKAGD